MPKDLLIHTGVAETCIAVVADGALERYWQEQTIGSPAGGGAGRVGDIVLGRVGRVLPSLEAAFVDIGGTRSGFLSARDAAPRKPVPGPPRAFAREGDAVLVQIAKEPVADKGARLTAKPAISGRYLVYMPGGDGVAVSRRIEDKSERARLMSLVAGIAQSQGAGAPSAGFIARTAALGAGAAALQDDAERLEKTWRGILAARREREPPATLYREPGLIERALRDESEADIRAIMFDDRRAAEAALSYARDAVPALAAQIELYSGSAPLFEAFGIEDAIAALDSARVGLPSGGWITIETTEAMTTIDVNSGQHADGGNFEDASLAVNLQAAETVARQLALREIGGLIVVDFIHLSNEKDVARLADALRAALARDPAPAEVSPVSKFGLLAITRKRERDALGARRSETCACCNGLGRRKNAATVALEILRQAERMAACTPGTSVVAFASADVAEWLRAREETIAPDLARRGVRAWRVVAEPDRVRESFAVETQA